MKIVYGEKLLMFPALRVLNLGQGPIKGPKWILWFDARLSTHFLNTELKTFFSLTASGVRLLRLGVCGKR